MCAINGFNWKDDALVERMNAVTRHRGPDGTGVFSDEGVSLGHNRLAIIDLSPQGAQPMKSADGRFVIAFNGEIYNYKELRAELAGYPYKSESDTEVILAGFERWGTDIFARLNGIFALGIWDTQRKELYLARDRAGVKPLYVYRSGARVIFSSEVKAILEHRDVRRSLNVSALGIYLRLGYVPGEETLFSGVRRLPAGSYVRIAGALYEPKRYFSPRPVAQNLTGHRAEEALRSAMDAAVERQLVSDRPLGVYLSGGIDSSVIVDSMSRTRSSIDTYSVGFELPGDLQEETYNADFLLARRTAAHYGTRHHEFMLGTAGLPKLFEEVMYHLDEPIGNTTALAQYALAQEAKKTVTVVVGGDGGDELFGGYPRYLMNRRVDAYQRVAPAFLRSLLSGHGKFSQLNTPSDASRYALFHFIKNKVLSEVAPAYLGTEAHEKAAQTLQSFGAGMPFGDAFMRLDQEWWLVDESLMRTDKMGMAFAVEARVPFLDNEVVDLAARMPLGDKVTLWDTKRVLKRAFEARLPHYILDQPKRGWLSPATKWLQVPEFTAYAREALSPGYAKATRALFDWQGVERVFEDHLEGRRYNLHVLLMLLALQVWARRFNIEA
ncbi:MAG: asparagine synthase (glutamine-hydrolyzing) [Minisyncoccia bacterium]